LSTTIVCTAGSTLTNGGVVTSSIEVRIDPDGDGTNDLRVGI
jgi:hypothetical protein